MIEVTGLSKSFYPRFSYQQIFSRRQASRVDALVDINLKVERGTVLGLVGPNGAGKTTFLKILATLILPDRGTVRVSGYDAVLQPDKVRCSIGLITNEERSFYWRVSGRANLEFFGRLNNIPASQIAQRISQISDLLALDGLDQMVAGYSAGMRQKLNLTRSLIADPPVLLIDEPTRSLDMETSGRLRRFIREELALRQGKTILLVTHNPAEAKELCHRIAVMRQGRIVNE